MDREPADSFSKTEVMHTILDSEDERTEDGRGVSFSDYATKCYDPWDDVVAEILGKAKELDLKNTVFCEPTGLDEANRSCAIDCAKLLYFALQDSVIGSILNKTSCEFVSLDRRQRRHRIGSTNKLLFSSLNVRGGKTGYNGASGWCLGTLVEGEDGKEIVAVVLGAPTKHTRFKEIRSIVEWAIRRNVKGS